MVVCIYRVVCMCTMCVHRVSCTRCLLAGYRGDVHRMVHTYLKLISVYHGIIFCHDNYVVNLKLAISC